MSSVRGMTIPDLVADPDLVQRLIDEGETLFVERKARDPKIGLGATLASFANMLGGWLLLGVDDDGNVVGYEPPGTADLQDYIRDLLRVQIDPLPPFVALSGLARKFAHVLARRLRSLLRERARELGADGDDCVSSGAGVSGNPGETLARRAMQ